MGDILTKEDKFGNTTTYYSTDYVESLIKQVYHQGLSNGVRIEFHAVTPMNGDMVDDLTEKFWEEVDKEYRSRFQSNQFQKIKPHREDPEF